MAGNTTAHLPEEYREVNGLEQVPTLEVVDVASGHTEKLTQSLAILEYLDETFPDVNPLFPKDRILRARAREVYIYISMYTCIHVCMYACMYACMH